MRRSANLQAKNPHKSDLKIIIHAVIHFPGSQYRTICRRRYDDEYLFPDMHLFAKSMFYE